MNKKQSDPADKEATLQLLKTEDGSLTLFDPDLNETYHSLRGAQEESKHVYIKKGLHRIQEEKQKVNILEIGFGTGLNALLTLSHHLPSVQINYFAVEAFPLSYGLLDAYYAGFQTRPDNIHLLNQLLNAGDVEWTRIHPNFNFALIKSELKQLRTHTLYTTLHQEQIDLVYYDAFAPSRQPEMWDLESLGIVHELMRTKALLTTYCAQGEFKRTLKKLGFQLEHPPGAHRKREMTVAIK